MEITSAEFVISNTDVNKCPGGTENDLPGRSICFSVYNWSAKEKIRSRVLSQPRQGSVMDLP